MTQYIKHPGQDTANASAGTIKQEVINGAAHVVDGALAFRMEDTGTYTYFGEAIPGTLTSETNWRISRMTNADNTVEWAEGNGNFDNEWDERANLSYS